MITLYEVNKCPNCGGELTKEKNKYRCQYCDTEFKYEVAKAKDGKIGKAEDGFIKTDWFDFKVTLKRLQRGPDSKEALHSFNYCINELGNSEAIIRYISTALLPDYGIYAPGAKEGKMGAFIKKLQGKITPSDNILFYANTGIFSNGKQGFIMTDEKIVFGEKELPELYFSDLTEIAFGTEDDFVGIYLNNSTKLQIYNISGGSFKPHGAFAALAAAFSFEANPDREKIVISEYKDNL